MKRTNISLVMLMLLCTQIQSYTNEDATAYNEIRVGVIIDMGSWVGNTVHSYITMAVTDFYTINSHYKTRIVLHTRDTNGVPLHALSAALDLLEEPKVQAIIGSQSAAEAKFLAVLGDEARVPILSFSPSPSQNYHTHPYFLQITQDETIQFEAISAMAESFGCKNVIIICENNDNGREMATFITKVLQARNIFITYSSLISVSSTSELVHEELQKLSMMETKIIIMHTSPSLASHLLQSAKDLGMMNFEYKWIITDKTMNFLSLLDDGVFESIQGAIIGFKSYIPQSKELEKFYMKWGKDINAYGIWAYDALYALAMATEKTHILKQNKNDLETTSSGQWGPTLLNQMLRISFNGLGGAFRYMNGRISADVVEMINVMGNEENRVGFWAKNGTFTKIIGKTSSFYYQGLDNMVWPTNPTRRVLQQVTSKVLKIGIPVQFRKGSLFNVSFDDQTNLTVVTGFCKDVFHASLTALNPDVVYELIPFIPKAEAGTVNYNDLIHQVESGKFDAAIGDITITANRSLYVDFTLPYTDIGLATLTKNVDATTHASMWVFLEPLSSDLWIVSACFCILLGFIIWIFEHQINEEFQGSPSQQIGTTLWFAFSTIVYAQRQKLQSNLSRFVVTVWLFVVFVLVSSYTATLSSFLTVERIQLASNRGSIGYPYGSPVQGFLVNNLNFNDTSLKPYSTFEDYAVALSRGSKNGGVDAIVDEIPYIKEFLVKYQSGYSMDVSADITNGFGFAFPLGSPLAREFSRQIAKLREQGTLKELEDKWFNPRSNASAPSLKAINFKGLRGLFLIVGVSMTAALFIFVVNYIREKLSFNYKMLAEGKLAFLMKLFVAKTTNAA